METPTPKSFPEIRVIPAGNGFIVTQPSRIPGARDDNVAACSTVGELTEIISQLYTVRVRVADGEDSRSMTATALNEAAATPGPFKFKNGEIVQDKTTGFEGIITARTDYLTGCNRYDVESNMGQGHQVITLDEDRLLSMSGL